MRISGGAARGRTLDVPPAARPTTDRVRQAIFNVLRSLRPIEGRGLDLYAGSGALGIEGLSRGLSACDFVEERSIACRVIKENLARAGFQREGRVICAPAINAGSQLEGPYSLVFADPPYADDGALGAVNGLESLLDPGAVIVVEHSGRRQPPERVAGRPALRFKRYGDSAITFYGRGG
ncbi:MAG: 16S rRNA (guanine(966)-N(2))-methyltransferase RsmD [Dehalococcoidia bacterium]|nr:16S rRNA (guanine(966)-N(2))-methyltransferase RsmD [Dehalococcoidia bacterium]